MGAKCCGSGIEEIDSHELGSSNAKFNVKSLYMADFETLVKKYAHPANKGMIKPEQLMEAFKDTRVFNQLKNPSSVINRVVMSPFFTDFTMIKYQAVKEELQIPSRSATPERLPGQLSPSRKKDPVINDEMAIGSGTESREVSVAQNSMMEEIEPSGISLDALLLVGILQCRGSTTVKSTCL